MKVKSINYVHKLHDLIDSNVDVLIHLKDGRVFSATVFTLENIKQIMARHSQSGESANGLYFWTSDMIIVRQLDRTSIETSIRAIIEDEGSLSPFEVITPAD